MYRYFKSAVRVLLDMAGLPSLFYCSRSVSRKVGLLGLFQGIYLFQPVFIVSIAPMFPSLLFAVLLMHALYILLCHSTKLFFFI